MKAYNYPTKPERQVTFPGNFILSAHEENARAVAETASAAVMHRRTEFLIFLMEFILLLDETHV